MPRFGFNLSEAAIPAGAVYTSGDGRVSLRKLRSTAAFDPTGAYSTDEVVTCAALAMPGLSEMFSFVADVDYDLDSTGAALGSVGFQISMDGGTTWYYWHTGAWTATTTSYSPASDIDANCLTIPRPSTGTIAPRCRFKLSADSTLRHTPYVRSIDFAGEVRDLPFEDTIRSIIKYLQTYLLVDLEISFEKPVGGTIATIPTKWTLASVSHIWNVTADPGLTTNILSSVDLTTKRATLTGALAQGTVLRARFRGTCPVKPLAEEEFTDGTIPTIPAFYVLPLRGADDDRFSNWHEIETSRGRGKARSRVPVDIFLQSVRVYCDSDRNTDAFQMAESISRVLEGTPMMYIPTGEPMALIDIIPLNSQDLEARGLYSKQVEFTVEFRRHDPDYREDALVRSITAVVTDIEATTIMETATEAT